MRFSLIDKITGLEPGSKITAIKNLSLAEEYLQDHFPGFPVLPGVLMVEAMVQSAAWLVRHTEDFSHSTVLLKQARGVKFNTFVSPGQTLVVEVSVKSRQEGIWVFDAAGSVNGASAVSAKLTLERFNLADRNPELASSDEHQITQLKNLFRCLWNPA